MRNCVRFLAAITIIVIGICKSSHADSTFVSGQISGNVTWTATNSPYVVEAEVYVISGGALTIQPGTKVVFKSNTGLHIGNVVYWDKGSISAIGKPDSLIVFTSFTGASNGWKGIWLDAGSNYPNGATLRYCVIEKAGQPGYNQWNSANLYSRYTSVPIIDHCIIRDGAGCGVIASQAGMYISNCTISGNNKAGIITEIGSTPHLDTNLIEFNGSYGVLMGLGSTAISSDNTYLGNGYDIAALGGGLPNDVTWYNDGGKPIVVLEDIYSTNGYTLTIRPGTTIKFLSNTGLQIGHEASFAKGSLMAVGTPDSIITFTSYSGVRGDWKGICFLAGSMSPRVSVLKYCSISNAGQVRELGAKANVLCSVTDQPTISHCVISGSTGCGVMASQTGMHISNCTISGNQNTGLITEIGSTVYLDTCLIENNGNYGVLMSAGATFVPSGNTYANNGIDIAAVGGAVAYDVTWYNDGGHPIVVLEEITIYGGKRLTINPGVTVAFQSNTGLHVGNFVWWDAGSISAIGKPDSQIVFTSYSGQSNGWKGILLDAGSNYLNGATFRYCVIEKAGQPGYNQWNSANLYSSVTSVPIIDHCTIRDGAGCGIIATQAEMHIVNCTISGNDSSGLITEIASTLYLDSCAIENNGNYGVLMSAGATFVPSGNTYANNGIDIAATGGSLPYNVTWYNDGGHPIVLLDEMTIFSDKKLTIKPGVTVAFKNNTGLRIGNFVYFDKGNLSAIGTPDSQVVFTSYSGQPNGWKGILLDAGSNDPGRVTLRNCVIEKAGQSGYNPYYSGNLYYSVSSAPTVDHCVVRRGSGCGICVYQSSSRISNTEVSENAIGVAVLLSSPTIESCSIINNTGTGITIEWNSRPVIGGSHVAICQLFGNGSQNLVNNTTDTIYARYNYWGAPDSVGIAATIYDCHDDVSKGCVLTWPTVYTKDAKVDTVLSPVGLVAQGSVVIPSVVVKNVGWEPVTPSVVLKIQNTLYADTAVVSRVLNRDEIDTVHFKPWTATPPSLSAKTSQTEVVSMRAPSMKIVTWTVMPGDGEASNDTAFASVAVGTPGDSVFISNISPNHGGNTGVRVVTITGNYFQQGATVSLRNSSNQIYTVDSIFVISRSASKIIVMLNLIGLSEGNWDVVITNPDSSIAVARNGFSVERGQEALNISITGPSTVVHGRTSRFLITASNDGNTDAIGAMVTIVGIPSSAIITLKNPLNNLHAGESDSLDWKELPYAFESSSGTWVVSLFLPYLPTDSVKVLDLSVTTRFLETFSLEASIDAVDLYSGQLSRFARQSSSLFVSCFSAFVEKGCFAIAGHYSPVECLVSAASLMTGINKMILMSINDQEIPMYSVFQWDASAVWSSLKCAHFLFNFWPPTAILEKVWTAVDWSLTAWGACVPHSPTGGTLSVMSVSSIDPNDKIGPAGYNHAKRFISGQSSMFYSVQFENVDSATASADSIWITDTLSPNLDWSSVQFGDVFPGAGPDSIRPGFTVVKDFDPYRGVITWGLFNINLPPDTAPYWGQGWVNYSVKPKSALGSGSRIENLAHIKFDNNPWISAPMNGIPIFNTIDSGAPVSKIDSLDSVTTMLHFPVKWSGHDDPGGSGVASYSIYYRDNGGPLTLWISDSVGTSAKFTGQNAHTYKFYSVARDNVGHTQPLPSFPSASTTVSSCCLSFAGNVDCDSANGTDISDLSRLVDYLYISFSPLCCVPSANTDGDGSVDISDLSALVDYLYISFKLPAACP